MSAIGDGVCNQALAILRRRGPMRASDLGRALWGGTTEAPHRGEGSHRQNKFARTAERVIRELERRGKVIDRIHGKARLWEAI